MTEGKTRDKTVESSPAIFDGKMRTPDRVVYSLVTYDDDDDNDNNNDANNTNTLKSTDTSLQKVLNRRLCSSHNSSTLKV